VRSGRDHLLQAGELGFEGGDSRFDSTIHGPSFLAVLPGS
jgi:hypothetical protein